MSGNVVRVALSIPNEGHAPVEAYANRLENFKYLGNLEARGLYKNESPRFEFFFLTLGRILTPLAREEAAKWAEEIKADYLYMIDDDMTCPNDLFERLYAHHVDIVAPLAFTRNYPHKAVIYEIKEGWDPVSRSPYFINHHVDVYPKDQLVECDAVGFGAALINMKVIRSMKGQRFMDGVTSGTGEDILFCSPDGIVYGDFNDISTSSNEAITHTGRKEKVDEYHKREYSGTLVSIKPLYTEPIRLTPNHPVMVLRGSSHIWVNAGDLKGDEILFFPKPRLNDYVHTIDLTKYAAGATITDQGIAFTRTRKSAGKIKPFVRMTPDLARLFGWYVAEGNSTKNNVVFSLNFEKEQSIAAWIEIVMEREFGSARPCISKRDGSMQVTFTSSVLARFFKETFGDGATHKRFPTWICDNKRFSGNVLRGLWDGDGYAKDKTLTTTSRTLAHQVKNILAAYGVVSSIRIGTNENRAASRNYSIAIIAGSRKRFGELLGYDLPDVKNLNRINAMQFTRVNDVEGWRVPIERIVREPFSGMVYNLGVKNNHSYVFNGIAVHNCHKARKLGFHVYMDTATKLGHLSHPIEVTEAYVEKVRKEFKYEDKVPVSSSYTKDAAVLIVGN